MEVMAGCRQSEDGFANRIVIIGSGTSLHAALVAEYLIEQVARIPVEVVFASEFQHRKPLFRKGDVLILVTASGETLDIVESLRKVRAAKWSKDILCLAVTNSPGSTVEKESDCCIHVYGGTEVGATATKVFSAQLFSFALMAIALGDHCGALPTHLKEDLLKKAQEIPNLVSQVLEKECVPLLQKDKAIDMGECPLWDISCENVMAQNFLFLGRGFNFPVALEGATKCKEIAYIHAEGYPAAEMKHGPIALIDQFMPVVVICPPSDPCYHKIISNLQEVKTRNGCVIAITEAGNEELRGQCERVIEVPQTHEYFTPILNVIPVQLLAYMMGILRGNKVTNPRGLRKVASVAATQE